MKPIKLALIKLLEEFRYLLHTSGIKPMQYNFKDITEFGVDGIEEYDYPDFCDAYYSYATWKTGHELTESELDIMGEELADSLQQYCCTGGMDY